RVEREPQVGTKVVRTSDQASTYVCDFGSAEYTCGGLDHRQYRPANGLGNAPNEVSGNCARNDDEVGFRAGCCVQVERMPLRSNTVDPDRNGHRPVIGNRANGGHSSRGLVRRAYRVLEVKNDEIA